MPSRVARPNPTPRTVAHLAVVTVLDEAYTAARRAFRLAEHETRAGYEWLWGYMHPKREGEYIVVVGQPLDRTNVAAAVFVSTLLRAWSPRYLLLADIAGGVKGRDDLQLGDVVVNTQLHYYEHRKITSSESEAPRYLPIAPASTRLRELSRRPASRGDHSWTQHIEVPRPSDGIPKVVQGEMLVGEALQADSPYLRELLHQYDKALAIEMEGVGVARAVLDISTESIPPELLIVRGISDYVNVPPDENQATRDQWRAYAAAAAIAHAYAIALELDAPATLEVSASTDARRLSVPSKPIDNLWEARSTIVRGRDRELGEIVGQLSATRSHGDEGRIHVIWGEAGMGKSVLALEAAARVSKRYSARWWVDASDELKTRASLRDLARRLGIESASSDAPETVYGDAESHRFLRDLREALDAGVIDGRALFILDNVDDPLVKHKLPQTTLRYLPGRRCDVLITSQSSRWHPTASSETPLTGLTPREGAILVATESNRPELQENRAVHNISDAFAGRPLFLKQVAALLGDGEDPESFLGRMNQSLESALEVLPELEGFNPLWSVTYREAIGRADRARNGARGLIEVMSFLAPEPIPETLVMATARPRSERGEARVKACLRTLADRSLIVDLQHTLGGAHSYSLHRVIAAIVRMEVQNDGRSEETLSLVAHALDSCVPTRDLLRQATGQVEMAPLAPHVEVVATALQSNIASDNEVSVSAREMVAEASSMLGLYRRTLSEWEAAQEAHEAALLLSAPLRDAAPTALRQVRLANVMRQRGLFVRAEELLDEALPVLEEGGDRRDYAWALTVKARIFRARPDSASAAALPLLHEALKILGTIDSEEDPNTRRQLSELYGYISVISRLLSRLDDAEEAALEGLKTISGGLEPDEVLYSSKLPAETLMATHLRALGGIWRLRGNFERAMRAHQRALEIYEAALGRDHTDVGRALDSLGRVQREWGDYEAAIISFTRAREISDLRFGLNYPHAGTASVNLAITYLELGDAERALAEAEEGLRIYGLAYEEQVGTGSEKVIRNEATAWALFVRANALLQLDETEQAHHDHQIILAWRESRYADPHAHVASSHFALGDVFLHMATDEDVALGLWHHQVALDIRERVFSKQPNFWLAQSYARVGELTRNKTLLEAALRTFEDQLRSDNWRIREVRNALRALNDA